MTRKVDHLIIHCSATQPDPALGAADIDRWHRAQGWNGNGYHYVIRTDGTIETAEGGHKCRPLDKAGAHVGDCGSGWNARSLAVCLIGGVDARCVSTRNYTLEQWAALNRLVPEILRRFPTISHLGGHRDLIKLTRAAPKDCPCFDVADWWEFLRPAHPDLAHIQTL